jgi:hypothetical protein
VVFGICFEVDISILKLLGQSSIIPRILFPDIFLPGFQCPIFVEERKKGAWCDDSASLGS